LEAVLVRLRRQIPPFSAAAGSTKTCAGTARNAAPVAAGFAPAATLLPARAQRIFAASPYYRTNRNARTKRAEKALPAREIAFRSFRIARAGFRRHPEHGLQEFAAAIAYTPRTGKPDIRSRWVFAIFVLNFPNANDAR
jgi:hypothetical protein